MIIITILSALGIVFYKPLVRFFPKYHRFITNFSNKTNFLRILSVLFCILIIMIYFIFRWIPSVSNISEHSLFNQAISEYRSANLSIFFMLDICSILAILFPFLIIFDWKHKYLLEPLAPVGILGGLATILFTIPDLYNKQWDFYAFIFGSRDIGYFDSDEPLMFLMHFWMVCIGFYVLSRNGIFSWHKFIILITFILCYAGYISLIAYTLNIKSHVTAIVIGDFNVLDDNYYHFKDFSSNPHPSYEIFKTIFGIKNWSIAPFVTWITFTIIVLMMLGVNNSINFYMKKINKKKYIIV